MSKGSLCNQKAAEISLSLLLAMLFLLRVTDLMVDAIDFICGTNIHIHPSCMPIRYLVYMTNLVAIFVSGTCMVPCKVNVAVGCVVAYMCKNVRCVCQRSVLFLWDLFV